MNRRMSIIRPAPWLGLVLRAGVAVGLLVVLWHVADGPQAARSLGGASWPWLVLAVVALTLQTLLSALRWRLTARQLGIDLGGVHAVREYYLGQVVNQALPGGVVGDVGRAVRARAQAGLMASGLAVMLERLAGQIAMALTLAVAVLATVAVPGGVDWPAWLLVPVLALLAAMAALPVVLLLATRLPGRAGRAATGFGSALVRVFGDRRALPAHMMLSLGTTVCNLAAFALCARAVDVALDPITVVALVPVILFAMVIPLSIAGWGLREGAAVVILPVAGVAAGDALAASVAFGLTFIMTTLPGVAAVWIKPRAAARHPG
jgi:uncharacterized protein (TIRG00374 family)